MAPSDSDRDCSSAHRYHPADPASGVKWPYPSSGMTGVNQDSESGGSQPPSPRASRRKQVQKRKLIKTNTSSNIIHLFKPAITKSILDFNLPPISPPFLHPVPRVPCRSQETYRRMSRKRIPQATRSFSADFKVRYYFCL